MHSLRLKNDLMRVGATEDENLRVYITQGGKIFDNVCKIITSKSSYRISRQLIAGSMGKKTSLGYDFEPDFDVVLFVYDKISSLTPVVDEFYEILRDNLPTQCAHWTLFDVRNLAKNPFGLMFSMQATIQLPSGPREFTISFDLLPAFCFSTDVDEHTRMVLKKIEEGEDWNIYSTSLCEKTVQFVKYQPVFVHYLIRLAKKWDLQLKNRMKKIAKQSPYISGRSSIIELVAIHAAREEKNYNILEAFRRFLTLMKGIGNIHINFYDTVVRPSPWILDAVNPYNNYAKAIQPMNKTYFQIRAEKTLEAMEQAENGRDYEGKLKEFMSFLV